MKQLMVLIALLLLFSNCSKQSADTGNPKLSQEDTITNISNSDKANPNRSGPSPPEGAMNLKNLMTDPEGLFCSKDSEIPFSGKVYAEYLSGNLSIQGTLKDGKYDGTWFIWYENGQKQSEEIFKEGKSISLKEWNERGEIIGN